MTVIDKPLKYDNCLKCTRKCEHAGKNREFVCKDGKSCKVISPEVNGEYLNSKEMIDAGLRILDIQRGYCIQHGADKKKRFFFSMSGGCKEQNDYYNGHLNLIDSMLLPFGYSVAVSGEQKHYIYKMEGY